MLCVTLKTDRVKRFHPRLLCRLTRVRLHAANINVRFCAHCVACLAEDRLTRYTAGRFQRLNKMGLPAPRRTGRAYGGRSPNPSPWRMGRHRKVRGDTEVVARPDAVDVLVEGSSAVEDFQGRPVHSAPNHDVVNAAP